jgi:hypothetical protein
MAAVEAPLTAVATTNGSTPHDAPVTVDAAAAFDTSIFRSYLLSLLPPVIGATPAELEYIFDDEFDERVSRFVAEGGASLYVVKSKDETEGRFCYLYRLFPDGSHAT